MKRIRYLTMLVLLLCGSIGTWAQNDDEPFNPDNPSDPGLPMMKFDVDVVPSEAGSVSGTGRYTEGTLVHLTAYENTDFRFVNWTDKDGNILSTEKGYTHTKQAGHERLKANYVFDPEAPNDPADPWSILYFNLQLNTTEGGTAYGGGRYLKDQQVTLYAYPDEDFDFVGWYDSDGQLLSTDEEFDYVTTPHHVTLEARFHFNPEAPEDPDEPIVSRTVTATANEGGGTNFSSQRVLIGTTITLEAWANTGYTFRAWLLNGEEYTRLQEFSYTVTDAQKQNFEAIFDFTPDSPEDPATPTNMKHSFFLMNKVTKPGTTVLFPIYLTNVRTVKDMTFQLTFPAELPPLLDGIGMSERAEGYSVSFAHGAEENSYVLSFIGGQIEPGDAAIAVFTIPVPETIATGQNYQITINQVSVTEEDGSTVTASTRNGRISVYKLGDTNGDDVVDILDQVNLVTRILGKDTDVFIEEVSNVNDDDELDILDAVGIVEIILGK